jgi:hypothetical protein
VVAPNNHMQPSGKDKVPGRGRGRGVVGRVTSARVLKRARAVADVGRWEALVHGSELYPRQVRGLADELDSFLANTPATNPHPRIVLASSHA